MRTLLSLVGCLAFVAVPFAAADTPVVSRSGLDGFITLERLPVPDDPVLLQGHAVWGDTCQNCHGGNKATGAPKITSSKAWESRIGQGMAILIEHATDGFIGPRYTEMPPRGANPDLTDEEVAAAVAFMVWASGGSEVVETYLQNKSGLSN